MSTLNWGCTWQIFASNYISLIGHHKMMAFELFQGKYINIYPSNPITQHQIVNYCNFLMNN